MQRSRYSITIACVILFCATTIGHAQVRSSTNFQIQSDSINVGGGLSSSTTFVQESTVGEIATGPSNSASYQINAGYQQMQQVYIALSAATDVIMDPALGGITGGVSTGSTSVVATTDGVAGYQLSITASSSPALQSPTAFIADYVPSGAVPDRDFTFATTDAVFAYGVAGADTADRFLTNGAICGAGAASSTACWDGLSTTPVVIATGGANHPVGVTTDIYFRVGVGGLAAPEAGIYRATSTLTLLPL